MLNTLHLQSCLHLKIILEKFLLANGKLSWLLSQSWLGIAGLPGAGTANLAVSLAGGTPHGDITQDVRM